MIIEIKDLPNNQLISKVDLHIDFQNGSVTKEIEVAQPKEEEKKENTIPQEMLDAEF